MNIENVALLGTAMTPFADHRTKTLAELATEAGLGVWAIAGPKASSKGRFGLRWMRDVSTVGVLGRRSELLSCAAAGFGDLSVNLGEVGKR